MEYIYLGKIVNTHGIKGEIRIISDFQYKQLVFTKNFKIYIGNEKTEETINTYRIHKNYDMVTLININDINDVLKYKGKNVYINKSDLNIDGYFDEDLIGLEVYTTKSVGNVIEIIKQPHQDLLLIEYNDKQYMIPKVDAFINKIDLNKKIIYINNIEGLINEN